MEKVEGDAEQQCKKHDRAAVMLRQESRGEGNRGGNGQAGIEEAKPGGSQRPQISVGLARLDIGEGLDAVEGSEIARLGDGAPLVGHGHAIPPSGDGFALPQARDAAIEIATQVGIDSTEMVEEGPSSRSSPSRSKRSGKLNP